VIKPTRSPLLSLPSLFAHEDTWASRFVPASFSDPHGWVLDEGTQVPVFPFQLLPTLYFSLFFFTFPFFFPSFEPVVFVVSGRVESLEEVLVLFDRSLTAPPVGRSLFSFYPARSSHPSR